MKTAKLMKRPLALGLTRWGPLPGTTDLFLFWGGPGDGLHLEKGADGAQARVRRASGCERYDTARQAQRAVDAFVTAGELTEIADGKRPPPRPGRGPSACPGQAAGDKAGPG
jgi:hypothetical protein